MKEIKIPFSLTEYQKGGYEVETRGDKNDPPRKARIICRDRMGDEYNVLALLTSYEDNNECIYFYTENGKCIYFYTENGEYSIGGKSTFDLLLVKQEFEDGDIIKGYKNCIVEFIIPYRGTNDTGGVLTEAYYSYSDNSINVFSKINNGCGFTKDYHLATEEERKIFFDALEKRGKQWNAEKKCIEDIKSKFELKPKDWCLMSCGVYNEWVLCQFSNIKDLGYIAVGGKYFTQCIPYNDETKHLLGTTDNAPEKYKTW